jgi:hypothetical protein
LDKLKPILDHLNAKFRSVYTPESDVSVGEPLTMRKSCLLWTYTFLQNTLDLV